ncbi:acyltransferase [Sphingomonas sp.]|jgi:peptidoglycan/LPS O-acetylase OafA/YrhL|uniref:acyltransferase family protein n=3 Tax=unclassified Sphingomonas TaxID=196159 RepID=UPI0008348515|nr:acyltransferase [Sphingomonas sp.]MBX3595252.1 acyltransferase [Sphingomonas sp.]
MARGRAQTALMATVPIDDSNTATGPARNYVLAHNAIRGFAALGVFVYHLQLERGYLVPLGLFEPAVRRGYVWVDLFFILSGFVVSLSYQERLARLHWRPFARFMIARIGRIFPVHLLALLYLAALVIGIEGSYWLLGWPSHWHPLSWSQIGDLTLQAALLQVWSREATLSWNIPAWSISAEMHIYLLFPLLAALLAHKRQAAILLLGAVAVAVYGFILLRYPDLDILSAFALLRCLAGFSLGMVLQNLKGAVRLGARWVTLAQLIAIGAIAAILLSALHDVLLVPAFALLVASTASDRGLVARAAHGSALQWLGDISYSVYLLNFPVLTTAGLFWPRIATLIPPGLEIGGRWLWMTLLVLVLVGCATLTFRLVEWPLRDRLRGVAAALE